jgi:hypothetical protein
MSSTYFNTVKAMHVRTSELLERRNNKALGLVMNTVDSTMLSLKSLVQATVQQATPLELASIIKVLPEVAEIAVEYLSSITDVVKSRRTDDDSDVPSDSALNPVIKSSDEMWNLITASSDKILDKNKTSIASIRNHITTISTQSGTVTKDIQTTKKKPASMPTSK